jgi:hypothetical protein
MRSYPQAHDSAESDGGGTLQSLPERRFSREKFQPEAYNSTCIQASGGSTNIGTWTETEKDLFREYVRITTSESSSRFFVQGFTQIWQELEENIPTGEKLKIGRGGVASRKNSFSDFILLH